MIDRTTIAAIAAELGVCWHSVSSIAMRAIADLIAAAGPDRLAGVRVIGVDEHRWAPRRIGAAGYVGSSGIGFSGLLRPHRGD
jgi:transposase